MIGGNVNRAIGLFVLLSCFQIVSVNGQAPCTRVSDCFCRGDNFQIDLTPLTVGVQPPEFNTSVGANPVVYKPCNGFTINGNNTGKDTCSVEGGVAVCMVKPDNITKGLGLPKAEFIYDSVNKNYAVIYRQENVTTVIQLICVEAETTLTYIPAGSNDSFYNLQLTSSSSCPIKDEPKKKSGPSPGTVILILIAVITLVYFGGGILYLKCLQGAQGWEVIPNLQFWEELPLLIRDGFLFLLKGCKPPVAYDRI